MKNKFMTLLAFLKLGQTPLYAQRVPELVASGEVMVNDMVELDPNRVLYAGDKIQVGDVIIILEFTPEAIKRRDGVTG